MFWIYVALQNISKLDCEGSEANQVDQQNVVGDKKVNSWIVFHFYTTEPTLSGVNACQTKKGKLQLVEASICFYTSELMATLEQIVY